MRSPSRSSLSELTYNPVSRELGASAERPTVRIADYSSMWQLPTSTCPKKVRLFGDVDHSKPTIPLRPYILR